MKKILISMMTIAMVSAMIGGGIYAAFSDPETSDPSAFSAGTLDLTMDGVNSGAVLFSAGNWEPDKADKDIALINNIGNLDGMLEISFTDILCLESKGSGAYTADGDGDDDTIISSDLDGSGDDAWVGYTLVITSGDAANIGAESTVISYDEDNDTLELDPSNPLPADADGDTFRLHREYELDDENDTNAIFDLDVTVTTGGGTDTVTDASYTEEDDYWNGYIIVAMSGTAGNIGSIREVTGFSSGVFTLDSALPNPTAGSDGFHLLAGELADYFECSIYIDVDKNDQWDTGTDYYMDPNSGTPQYADPGATLPYDQGLADYIAAGAWPDYALAGNSSFQLIMEWDNSNAAGNECQGDNMSFIVDMTLDQDFT